MTIAAPNAIESHKAFLFGAQRSKKEKKKERVNATKKGKEEKERKKNIFFSNEQ